MAGTLLSGAHTRLVPAVRRADTRAKTEPRPRTEPLELTSPYPRNFEAENQGRESLPYLELEIDTEPQDALPPVEDKRRPLRIVKTVSRKLGVGTGREQALDPDERTTNAIPKQTIDALEELATEAFEKQSARAETADPLAETQNARAETADPTAETHNARAESETQPNGPRPRPSRLQWLGVVLSKPEVGAALMIGTWLRPEFCVTSPVMHVFPRGDGLLVQTTTKSLYFVGPDGDTYLVRKTGDAGQGTST
jgi:hypothetical protein